MEKQTVWGVVNYHDLQDGGLLSMLIPVVGLTAATGNGPGLS